MSQIHPFSDEDATILDSKFGNGKSEKRFQQMGLPTGSPKRSGWRWLGVGVVMVVALFLAHEEISQRDTQAQEGKRQEALQSLEKAFLLEDWTECRRLLKSLMVNISKPQACRTVLPRLAQFPSRLGRAN